MPLPPPRFPSGVLFPDLPSAGTLRINVVLLRGMRPMQSRLPYTMAGISGFYTLFSLLFVAMGAIFAISVPATKAGPGNDPLIMGAFFVIFGFAFLLISGAATWLTYYGARSLEVRRRWILCMILAGLWCLSFPFGTMIGVSVKALFCQGSFCGDGPKTCYPVTYLDRGAEANSSRQRSSGHLRSGWQKGLFPPKSIAAERAPDAIGGSG
jgi:hypothetical protein